jgi:AcrR family transcriptional regulator
MSRNHEINQRMRTESRAALLKAASELFAGQGFFNCSIADIAHKSQMSQGNVYWYFSSKEELLRAVLEDGFAELDELFRGVENISGKGIERLERLIDQYIQFIAEHIPFLTILAGLVSHGGSSLLRELSFDVHTIWMEDRQTLQEILLQAEQEGDLVPGSDLQALSLYFFALFNGLVNMDGDGLAESELQLRRAVYRLLGLKPGQRSDVRRYGKWERG